MDALQNDIDNLEREKVDMKKRLDAYSKKSLLADLARHASSSSSIAAVVAGTENHSHLISRVCYSVLQLLTFVPRLLLFRTWNFLECLIVACVTN